MLPCSPDCRPATLFLRNDPLVRLGSSIKAIIYTITIRSIFLNAKHKSMGQTFESNIASTNLVDYVFIIISLKTNSVEFHPTVLCPFKEHGLWVELINSLNNGLTLAFSPVSEELTSSSI